MDILFAPYVVTSPYTFKFVRITTVSKVPIVDTTLSNLAVPTTIFPKTAVFELILSVRIVLECKLP